MNNLKERRNKTKMITVCAMLSALGVVVLYLGSFIEVLDASMSVIASLMTVIVVIEFGRSASWSIYAVTAVLSLLLLPNKSPAVMYAAFFGFYPILKEMFERKSKPVSWILKEITFNAALVVCFLIIRFVIFIGTPEIPMAMYVIGAVLLEGVFVLYDLALTRLISLYIFKLRNRLKIGK